MKRYEYPRYFFSNKSLDILALCCGALHRLGIAYRRPRWDQVSVARREAVAALDVWVGPKTWIWPTFRDRAGLGVSPDGVTASS